jgi:hypothetical protein
MLVKTVITLISRQDKISDSIRANNHIRKSSAKWNNQAD